MKNIVFLCCLLFVVNATDAFQKDTKRIKQQVDSGFVPGSDGELIPDQSEVIKRFDEIGNLVEQTNTRFWAEMNKAMNYKRHFYYSDVRLDSSVVFNDDKFSLKLEYKYDEQGNVQEIQEYSSDRNKGFLTKHFFDSVGNKVREELFDKTGKQYNFKVYSYDKNKNLIDESGTEQGTKRYHWTYKYNKKNSVIERKDFSGQEVLLRKHKYEYDKENRLIRENIYNANGDLERVVKTRYEFY